MDTVIHPLLISLDSTTTLKVLKLQPDTRIWINDHDEVVLITPSGEEMVVAEFKAGTPTRQHMDELQALVDSLTD